MKNRVWLSYDLGVDGDYDGLYQWLDRHEAVECGDSCASFLYTSGNRAVSDAIKSELKKSMKLRPRDRVYLVFHARDGKIFGRFVLGGRKAAPWAGYAATEEATDEG
jgi:hypothetical protein